MDGFTSMILAASLGIGVLFSSVPVLVIEGGVFLLAAAVAPFLGTEVINEMTCAGSILIIMIGMNLMGITKIKVADYLPALIFAPVFCMIFGFIM
jgi:uncharacterized membrane protein YqgA involved in biofilm formation